MMDFRYLLSQQFGEMLTALPEEFNVLAMALESTNSGVVITDNRKSDNPIIFCNHAFENMTGYLREEIIGRNCRFLQGSNSEQQTLNPLREALSTGSAITIEVINYRKDGRAFWNELSIAPVRNSEGLVTHFIGMQNDISRKKTMETDLMEQIELLNKRVEKQQLYIKKVEGIFSQILHYNRDCVVFLDEDLKLIKANTNFYEIFQLDEEEVRNTSFMDIQNGEWNDPRLSSLLAQVLTNGKSFEHFNIRLQQHREGCQQVLIKGKKVKIDGILKDFILLNIKCISSWSEKENQVPELSRK